MSMMSTNEQGIVHPSMISGGSGVGYLHAINEDNPESELFWSKNPQDCVWVQRRHQPTEVQVVTLSSAFKNGGIGGQSIAEHAKTMDFIWRGGCAMRRPAMAIRNTKSSIRVASYVNCYGYTVTRELCLKIGSTRIFAVTGRSQMFLTDLVGHLSALGKWIGWYSNKEELVQKSRKPQTYMVPYIGMPFNGETQQAIGAGYTGMLKIEFVATMAPLGETYMYWGLNGKDFKGNLPVPYNLGTLKPLEEKDFQMTLLTKSVFFLKPARKKMMRGYLETLYQELVPIVQELPIEAWTAGDQRKEVPNITIKGPCTGLLITIQSETDIKLNHRTKFAKDNGEDHIKYAMLYAGNWYHQDCVMTPLHRFDVQQLYPKQKALKLNTFWLPFSHDWQNSEPTSFSDYTSGTDLKLVLILGAHAEPLVLNVDAMTWNGQWFETLSCGKVWTS